MKNIFIAIACFLNLSLFAFTGEIVLNYSNFNAGDFKVDNVTWKFKNDRAKMTLSMADAKGKISLNSFIPVKATESLIIYSDNKSEDGKNFYYDVSLNKIEDHSKTDYRAEKTTETKKILGYDCTKYLVYSSSTVCEMWVAASLDINYGSWAAFYKTNAEMQGLYRLGITGFPLESSTKSLAGNIIFQYTTQSVSAKSLDDKEFAVPAGYVLNVNNR